jgi:hypothetical protein
MSASGEAPNALMVELLIDGQWVDITSRVMVRDTGGNISISRGQTAEGQQPTPGTARFQLNNRDGLFSTGNAASPYWGKIGRNTQIRISVPNGEDKNYRFWGEVPAWPEDWDTTGTDVWVDIEGAGILRRLGQGSTPLRSTMYRGLTSAAVPAPVAYWPCEDGTQAASLASAIGGPAMTFLGGPPQLAGDSGFPCADPLPVLGGAQLVGQVPPYTVTGQTQVRWLMFLPDPPADGTQLLRVKTNGTVPYWALVYGTGGTLAIEGIDADGVTLIFTSGPISFAIDNRRWYFSLEMTQNGADVDWLIGAVGTDGDAGQFTGTFFSQTVGRVTQVIASPGQTITTGSVGHISVQTTVTTILDLAPQVQAFTGEIVTDRLARLCLEEGVNYTAVGAFSADTMGPQTSATFLALLQECVDVDQGVLLERETEFGLAYKPRVALYNQRARLTLSYSGNQLSEIPKPVPDDQNTRNTVTTSRPSGSSATATLKVGPLSVQPPPLGVGTYPDSLTLNVPTDSVLQAHAGWRVHLGTVNEPRYPAISVNLAHPAVAPLRNNVLRVLFGSLVVVTDAPVRLGGDIQQIVIGIQETITHFEHRLTFVCQPGSPYQVGVVDSATLGRVGSDTSTLAADMTPTSGTAVVSASSGFQWATSAAVPFDIVIAGERMTVSAVDASTPRNLTISARSVNGVVKTHQVGEDVTLAVPSIVAL